MPVSIQLKVERGKVTQSLTNLGQAIPRVTNAAISDVMEQARVELAQPGQDVSYPIHWDSDKQRRAYFASNGFGHGIPYRRTGTYQRGFQVQQTGSGFNRSYTISNQVPYSRYVGGTAYSMGQSRIHQGRWQKIAEVVRRYALRLVQVTTEAIHRAISEAGGGL